MTTETIDAEGAVSVVAIASPVTMSVQAQASASIEALLSQMLQIIEAEESAEAEAELEQTAIAMESLVASTAAGAAATVVYTMLTEDNLDVSAVASMSAKVIERVIDTLIASEIAESKAQATNMLVAAMAADAAAAIVFSEQITDQTEVQAIASSKLTSIQLIVESMLAVDEATANARFLMICEDGTVPAAEAASFGIFLESVSDSVECAALLKIGDDEYFAWVVNTETAAASYYDNYGFSSFARFDDRHFGTMPDGIYELVGDSDAGADIKMLVKGGLTNFGSSALKSIPIGYLYLKTDGEVLLKLTETGDGEKSVHWYKLEGRTGGAIHTDRFDPDKGIESTYFQFTVENVDGADIEVDGLRVFPLVMGRRI